MESQIFTVLSKRFKSGRMSFSKFGATCLSKICANRVEKGLIEVLKMEPISELDYIYIVEKKSIKCLTKIA